MRKRDSSLQIMRSMWRERRARSSAATPMLRRRSRVCATVFQERAELLEHHERSARGGHGVAADPHFAGARKFEPRGPADTSSCAAEGPTMVTNSCRGLRSSRRRVGKSRPSRLNTDLRSKTMCSTSPYGRSRSSRRGSALVQIRERATPAAKGSSSTHERSPNVPA